MAASNLIWLVFDSIRADRTTLGGHALPTTPNLEQIGEADTGVATTCFAHAIWSQPSVSSMLTGTYPSHHGAGLHNETLPEEVPTVAERFSDSGFRTEALSLNPYFSETTGLDRGFDKFEHFDPASLARECPLRGLLSLIRDFREFSGGFSLEDRRWLRRTPDYLLHQVVKDRLSELSDGGDPFFLCAHFTGVHHPYYPSPVYRSKFGSSLSTSPSNVADTAYEKTQDVYRQLAHGCPFSDEEREAIRAMYDSSIAQTDALVGRLIDHVDQLGLEEETILVITSDHGDLLGEYGLLSHKLLVTDELIDVPIAIRGSERLRDANLTMAQHIDVMQTALDELGVDTDGMHGRSLPTETPEYAITQRGEETRQQTYTKAREYNEEFDPECVQSGFVTAYRTPEWKFIDSDDAPVLYDLPNERTDVSSEFPDVTADLEDALSTWMNDYAERVITSKRAEFDADVEERLTDLGYVVD